MFWTLYQTERRKLEGRSSARNSRPQTGTRKPADSNRESKLLEIAVTPRKQSAITHSNREKAPQFFGPSFAVGSVRRNFKSAQVQAIEILIGNHND